MKEKIIEAKNLKIGNLLYNKNLYYKWSEVKGVKILDDRVEIDITIMKEAPYIAIFYPEQAVRIKEHPLKKIYNLVEADQIKSNKIKIGTMLYYENGKEIGEIRKIINNPSNGFATPISFVLTKKERINSFTFLASEGYLKKDDVE